MLENIIIEIRNQCVTFNPLENKVMQVINQLDDISIEAIHKSTLKNTNVFNECKKLGIFIPDDILVIMIQLGYLENIKDVRMIYLFMLGFPIIQENKYDHIISILAFHNFPDKTLRRTLYNQNEDLINTYFKNKKYA